MRRALQFAFDSQRNGKFAPQLLQRERRIEISSRGRHQLEEEGVPRAGFMSWLYVSRFGLFIRGARSVNEKSRSQLARLFAVKRRAVGSLLDDLC